MNLKLRNADWFMIPDTTWPPRGKLRGWNMYMCYWCEPSSVFIKASTHIGSSSIATKDSGKLIHGPVRMFSLTIQTSLQIGWAFPTFYNIDTSFVKKNCHYKESFYKHFLQLYWWLVANNGTLEIAAKNKFKLFKKKSRAARWLSG